MSQIGFTRITNAPKPRNCEGYENLEWLELREGTLKIGSMVFYGGRKLSRIDPPSSLHTIDDEAFAGCPMSN